MQNTANRSVARRTFGAIAAELRGGADRPAIAAALCAAPISIAVSETFLAVALLLRLARVLRGEAAVRVSGFFWFWLMWAGLEAGSWVISPRPRAGVGEMRHLLLVGALFITLSALGSVHERVRVWRGVLIAATIGSLSVILGFVVHLLQYRHELAAGGDPAFYLRSGGLLHHWMVYATVEALLFGGLLEFRAAHPEQRGWLTPALFVHCLAIVLSLSRGLWLACLAITALHLMWRRSRWLWAVPLAPMAAFLFAPGPIHERMAETLLWDYYSNAERIQMARVGWRMVSAHPLTGVGPGRIEELYTRYLRHGEPVPAYHGHLHNNAIQLAAQFGVPVLLAAVVSLAVVLWELWRARRQACSGDEVLLCRSGVLGVVGFLGVGIVDYTYGHSLGLILLMFVAMSPLRAAERLPRPLRSMPKPGGSIAVPF